MSRRRTENEPESALVVPVDGAAPGCKPGSVAARSVASTPTHPARRTVTTAGEQTQADTSSRSTRDLILDAADARFAEHGFDNARLIDITADVGLTTGALYRHFPAKDDLPVALLDSLSDDLVDSVSDRHDQRAAVQALLDALDRHPGALRMFFERSRWAGRRTPRDPRAESVKALTDRLDVDLPVARRRLLAALVVDMLMHQMRAAHDGGLTTRPSAVIAETMDQLIATGVYPDPDARPGIPMPPWDEVRFEPSIRWQASSDKVLPRSVKGIRTRQMIQDAAARVFTQRGLAQATMNDVAEEAGIASGSVYRYFADKADILHSLQAAVEEAIIRESHLPLDHGRLAIHGQMLAYLDCYERHLGAIRAWRELAAPGSELAAAWNGMRNSFIERSIRVLRYGQTSGIAREDLDMSVVADLHSMAYEGAAYSRLVLGYDAGTGVSKLADTMHRLFVGGFAA